MQTEIIAAALKAAVRTFYAGRSSFDEFATEREALLARASALDDVTVELTKAINWAEGVTMQMARPEPAPARRTESVRVRVTVDELSALRREARAAGFASGRGDGVSAYIRSRTVAGR